MSAKSILKKIISPRKRRQLKRIKRHIVNSFKPKAHQTSLEEMRAILTQDLEIKAGDRLIVSSSYGNLKVSFSPKDMIELIQSIVGEEGLIVMPYYPPINSTDWAAAGNEFDMRTTKSGMGVLTNVFGHMPNVYMSKHPTKAVCAWGKGAKELVEGHESATTPFFWDSPYGKLLKGNSKSLGLGLKNIPIFHAFEDILSAEPSAYYQINKYELKLTDTQGVECVIPTYVHDEHILDKCVAAGDYVRDLKCKSYIREKFGYTFVYVIDNNDLFERCKIEFANGHSRIKE